MLERAQYKYLMKGEKSETHKGGRVRVTPESLRLITTLTVAIESPRQKLSKKLPRCG